MSHTGTNFISDRFWQFCKTISIEHEISLVYHHWRNGQVKTCYKFIKCAFKKCTDFGRDINMALLQICTMLLGQGLPSPVTLRFNRQVCGIMPVWDHKPIVQDCDDDHHSKLVDRQQKNSNDASSIFACIPIGSAVAVQPEDGRPWTHKAVVGTGNHNHHDRSYTIQITTNGRHITWNRWHIIPTSITADAYLQYQSTKQSSTRTDPLADILSSINKNPTAYVTVQTLSSNNISGQYNEQPNSIWKEEVKDKEQYNSRTDNNHRQGNTSITRDNKTMFQDSEVLKTRSGWVVKKQTDWHMPNNNHKSGQHVSCINKCSMAGSVISWF